MSDVLSRLHAAFERRAPLLRSGHTTAFRLCNAEGDRLPHVTVDWFDGVAVLSLYRAFPQEEERALAEAIVAVTGARSVYLKRRPREARVVANVARPEVAPSEPLLGERVEQLEVRENGLRFIIRPGQGLPTGLYLDMRDVRAWLRDEGRVRGRTVLNTFAFTCAFGVYAHAGGAARAVNVDLSRRVLDWGEENLTLNGFPSDRRDHLSGDCFDWLLRLGRKGERFDVVILDPPSFSTSRAGPFPRFSAAKDYPRLVELAAKVVAPEGMLLAACNLEDLRPDRFERMCLQGLASAGRSARRLLPLGASELDFPSPVGAVPSLKVRAVSFAD